MKKVKRTLLKVLPVIAIVLVLVSADFLMKNIGKTGFFILVFLAVFLNIIPFIRALDVHPFFKDGKETDRILKDGIPATAMVLSVGENSKGGSITINNQPVFNVSFRITISGEQAYDVSFDSIVPRAMVSMLQPGAAFRVKVDPAKRQRFALDQQQASAMPSGQFSFNNGGTPVNVSQSDLNDLAGFFSNLSGIEVQVGNLSDEDRAVIKQKGNSVLAKLKKFEDSGRTENFQAVIAIAWEVHGVDNVPYEVHYEKTLNGSAVQIMKDVTGKTFSARVHPDNKEKLIITIA